MGCEMGFWELHSNLKMVFKPYPGPEFILLKPGEDIPDNPTHYYIQPEQARDAITPIVGASTPAGFRNIARGYMEHIQESSKIKYLKLVKLLHSARHDD